MYATLFVSLYFEVFLLITFFEKSESSSFAALPAFTPEELPTVAVFIPCWNEESTIVGTLNSLLALNYPKEKLEIIAVNDGSTDNTLAVLKTFESHPQVRIIDKENGGKHSAMNAALSFTKAEIVGCLDADSFVESDALLRIVNHFVSDKDVAAVTPTIKVFNAQSAMQVVQRAEYGLSVFMRNALAHMDSLFITPGPFSFFRRSVILEVGPWRHGHSTEDLEMCLRLQENHKKVTNEPNAIVYTKTPKTTHALFRQRVRWTYGFLKNAIDYRYMFFNPTYGTLGMLVLPMSLISLFSAIFLFSSLIWNTLVFIIQELVRFQTVGLTAPTPQFDIFFINTSVILSIVIVLIILTIVLMGIGKKLAKDSFISYDVPVYMALYGFITPVWLITALYKAVMNTGVRWR